ncbi:hypothetical protein Pfo_009950 [Paulownia fortunei]|nr:hypothetical protein Pfo_009950 [Paulownia fortunei]
MVELQEACTVVAAHVLEHMLQDAPLPFYWWVRFLILSSLPFASPPTPTTSPSV